MPSSYSHSFFFGGDSMKWAWLSNVMKQWNRGARKHHRKHRIVRPHVECFEDRTVPSVGLVGVPDWTAEGPAPKLGANTIGPTPDTTLAVGAVEALAVDPMNSSHVLAGAVNG